MEYKTYLALRDIGARWPAESSKIIQLLLAIALGRHRGGFAVTNHLTEGIDLDLVRGLDKFTVEVKTTEGISVTLLDKDIEGLRARASTDAYKPAVAALSLRYSPASEWTIASADRLIAKRYALRKLALDSLPALECAARLNFPRTVSDFGDKVLNPPTGQPLEFLQNVLATENAVADQLKAPSASKPTAASP